MTGRNTRTAFDAAGNRDITLSDCGKDKSWNSESISTKPFSEAPGLTALRVFFHHSRASWRRKSFRHQHNARQENGPNASSCFFAEQWPRPRSPFARGCFAPCSSPLTLRQQLWCTFFVTGDTVTAKRISWMLAWIRASWAWRFVFCSLFSAWLNTTLGHMWAHVVRHALRFIHYPSPRPATVPGYDCIQAALRLGCD